MLWTLLNLIITLIAGAAIALHTLAERWIG